MNWIRLNFCTLFLLIASNCFLQAQHNHFLQESIDLDIQEIRAQIKTGTSNTKQVTKIKVPMPKGNHIEYSIKEIQTLDKKAAKKYPKIKTYRIWNQDKSGNYRGALTVSDSGLHAYVFTPEGVLNIRPSAKSSAKRNHVLELGVSHHEGHLCLQNPKQPSHIEDIASLNTTNAKLLEVDANGSMLSKYRFAVVPTQSFYNINGGTDGEVTLALAVITNALNIIYENDFASRLVLVDPVYDDLPTTGEFDSSGSKPDKAMAEVNQRYPLSTFDIGHAFDTGGGGGVAYLNALCRQSVKGGGYSGAFRGLTSSWIQLAAHELGHMWGSPHSFSGDGGSCASNIGIGTSYEMASGITIMSYNGICGSGQNIPNNGDEDAYFHAMSLSNGFAQMNANASCGEKEDLGNTPPQAFADTCMRDLVIPKNTAFVLRGHATDPDKDALTYSWEQYDVSNFNMQGDIGATAADNTKGPLFRGYPPVGIPDRYIPPLHDIINNVNNPFEPLPNVARDLTFRFVVRDNNPGAGGVSIDELEMSVANSGPFRINTPNGGESLTPGQNFTFEWSTNGSDDLCDKIEIRISYDDGLTFDQVLATDLDYAQGAATVVIPQNLPSDNNAYIMMACADNTCVQFFDISNDAVSIQSNCLAQSTLICPSDTLFADEATDVLQMNLQSFRGAPLQSISNRSVSSAGLIPVAIWDLNKSSCKILSNKSHVKNRITVSESGDYVFRINSTSFSYSGTLSIFDAETFDENDLCSSFIASSGIVSNIDESKGIETSFLKATLEACKNYVIVAYSGNIGNTSSFPSITTVGGVGDVFRISDDAPADTYTYFAVDKQNNLIAAISDNGDFFELDPGSYDIFGVSYKDSGTTPPNNFDISTWIGSKPDDIFIDGNCFEISRNSRHVKVNTTCRILNIEEINRPTCLLDISPYNLMLEITHKLSPNQGDLVINGMNFPIESSPQIVELPNFPNDGQAVPIVAFFSDVPSCEYKSQLLIMAPENCCGIANITEVNRTQCRVGFSTFDLTIEVEYEFAPSGGDLVINEVSYPITSSPQTIILSDYPASGQTINIEGVFSNIPSCNFYVTLPDKAPRNCCGIIDVQEVSRTQCEPGISTFDLTLSVEHELPTVAGSFEINGQKFPVAQSPQIIEFKDLPADSQSIDITAFFENTPLCRYFQRDEIIAPVNCCSEDLNPSLGDNIQACAGDLVLEFDGGVNGVQYDWFKDDVPLALPIDTRIYNPAEENSRYHLVVTNQYGCSKTDSVMVEITPYPSLFISDDAAICDEEFYVAASNSNATSIRWFKDGNLEATDVSVLIVEEQAQYIVEAESGFNCITKDTFNLTVNPIPLVNLGDDIVLCDGQSTFLDAGPDGSTYLWRVDEDNLFMDQQQVEIFEGDVYTVDVTNEFGCVVSDTLFATFNPTPTLDLGPDDELCDGLIKQVVATSQSSNQYTWYKDGDMIIPDENDFVVTTTSGSFVVEVENDFACTERDTVEIKFNPNPVVDLGMEQSICGDSILVLDAGTDGVAYEWRRDFDPIDGATDQMYNVDRSGLYEVFVTNEFDCTTPSQVTVNVLAIPDVEIMEESEIVLCLGQTKSINTQAPTTAELRLDGAVIDNFNGFSFLVTEPGMYVLEGFNALGCSRLDTLKVSYQDNPVLDLGEDLIGCVGDEFTLAVTNNEALDFEWFVDNGSIDNLNAAEYTVSNSGTYSIVGTNEFGCQGEDEVQVTLSPIPNVLVDAEDQDLCIGDQLILRGQQSGATGINWFKDGDLFDQLPNVTVTTGGTYVFEAVGLNNCNATDTVVITDRALPEVELGDDMSACTGEEFILSVAEGATNYRWRRNTTNLSETGNEIVVAESGRYTVTVTNEFGCFNNDEVTIDVVDPPNGKIISDPDILCLGTSQTIDTDASDMENISWFRNGILLVNETEESINVVEDGQYLIVVTNAQNCETRDSIQIDQSIPPVVNLGADQTECSDVDIVLNAGAGGAIYKWELDGSPINEFGATVDVIDSGIYSVTVSNADGCETTDQIEINKVALPSVDIQNEDVTICTGESYEIISNLEGARFEWYLDNTLINTTTENLTTPQAGTYRLIVYNELDCPVEDEIVISISQYPEIELGADVQECADTEVVLQTGSMGLEYSWSLDGVDIEGQTGNSITVTETGRYTVTAQNEFECISTDDITIEFFELPTVQILEESIIACSDETTIISADVSAGDIQWYLDDSQFGETSNSFEVTQSGVYKIEISNQIGCIVKDEIEVRISENPTTELGEDQDICGEEFISLEAGPSNFEYQWSVNGENLAFDQNTLPTTESGLYQVTVTNPDGCESMDQVLIRYFPQAEVNIEASTVIICDGDAYFIASNFSGDSFQWFRDGVLLAETTSDIEVSQPGIYRIVGVNEIGCEVADEISITQSQTVIEVELGDGGDFCEGDDISLNAGDPALSYEWFRDGILISNTTNILSVDESGVYTVVAMSVDGCIANDQVTINIFDQPEANIVQEMITQCSSQELVIDPNFVGSEFSWTRDGVPFASVEPELLVTTSGIYMFTAKNEAGCEISDQIAVTIIEEPIIDLGINETLCQGDTKLLSVNAMDENVSWFLNDQLWAENKAEISATETGTYRVSVETAGICTNSDEINILFLNAPTVVISDDEVGACIGQMATVTGLTPSEDFTWLYNGTATDIETLSFDTDQAGEYVLEVINDAGCISRDTVDVLINDIPEINLDDNVVACEGSVLVLDAGPNGAMYQWSRNGTVLTESMSEISVDQSGLYEVLVTDQFGCDNTDAINVSIVPGPSLEVGMDESLCVGDEFVINAATNGTQIRWTQDGSVIGGATSNSITVTETATYAAIVTDATIGCEILDTVRIVFNALPEVDLGDDQPLCEGTSIELDISDVPANTIEWSRDGVTLSETGAVLLIEQSGNYAVEVSNEFGCVNNAAALISFAPAPTLNLDDRYDFCEMSSIVVAANSDGLVYNWFLEDAVLPVNADQIVLDQAGVYKVNITGANGCESAAEFQVFEQPIPFVSLGIDETLCPDESTILDAGEHAEYLWSTGETTRTINIDSPNPDALQSENISVKVTSEFGCDAEDEVIITLSGKITAAVSADASGVCEDESIILSASGGTIYEWLNDDGSLSDLDRAQTVASPDEATDYRVVVSDECPGNSDTTNIFIEVYNAADAGILTQDTCVILGLDIELEAFGGFRYDWEDNGTFLSSSRISSPIVMPSTTTDYAVTITDVNGCIFQDQVSICVIDDPTELFDAVSIFSPNDDGKNDFLEFKGLEAYPDNRLVVFDRWGSIVFDKPAYQLDGEFWDGTKNGQALPAGTYFYVLEFATFRIKKTLTIVRN